MKFYWCITYCIVFYVVLEVLYNLVDLSIEMRFVYGFLDIRWSDDKLWLSKMIMYDKDYTKANLSLHKSCIYDFAAIVSDNRDSSNNHGDQYHCAFTQYKINWY